MVLFLKQCSVFRGSFGGEGGEVLGECGAKGARRIFEPQGERVLSCGHPPPPPGRG